MKKMEQSKEPQRTTKKDMSILTGKEETLEMKSYLAVLTLIFHMELQYIET